MPTRNLTQLQDQVTRTIEAYGRTIEREILFNYAAALDAIRLDLAKVYEKYAVNGKLTHAEMSKFNRLGNLEKQITSDIKPVFAKDQRLINKMKVVTYDASFYRNAWAIDQASGVATSWGLLNPDAVVAAVQNDFTGLALKKLRQDGLLKTQRVIRQGIIQGKSYPQMAKLIKEQLIEPSASDALRIARTEGQRAMVQGQQATYDRAEEKGVELTEIWDATLDSRTRASHGKLDGVPSTTDSAGNTIWNTDVGPVAGPLQSGVASFDINCRCRIRAQIEGYEPKVRRIRDEGIVPYKTYNEWAKEKVA